MTAGRIHSIETMGLVDGPGVRTVFFLQGCPLRCAYCHNPDSQAIGGGVEMSPAEIVEIAKRYRPYHGATGGVTFSGGEPTLQGAFLVEALKLLKAEGIHTAIDTSGAGDPQNYAELLSLVDLVILDVKHFEDTRYRELTQRPIAPWLDFVSALIGSEFTGKVWIRHVMVPGWTDTEPAMQQLVRTIEPLRQWIERLEILPYHVMGVDKYEKLGLDYRLTGVPAMDKTRAAELETIARRLFAGE